MNRDLSSAGTSPAQSGPRALGLATGERIQGRYAVVRELGRGGMAVIYRATDLVTGRDLAVKCLVAKGELAADEESVRFFEREFYALSELSHPHIVKVFDYGIDERGPFYTMELLDGGDLRERAPLPWREACAAAYDVCSALALLHSRRLAHRDVSPRNIRCTQDGVAKLIDFGAIVAMGSGGTIVGTAQFIAPEVVYRSYTEARTDLFSLGATLYFALTGRPPYLVRDVTEAVKAWATDEALPPSAFVAEIPEALDALVMSLLAIDPNARPRTAFETMQRLTAIVGSPRVESTTVKFSYFATPKLVGRDEVAAAVAQKMAESLAGEAGAILIQGAPGLGRSRLLDTCAMSAKTIGARVLRASGSADQRASFRVVRLLVEQILETAPELALEAARAENVVDLRFEPNPRRLTKQLAVAAPALEVSQIAAPAARAETFDALTRWVLHIAAVQPLVFCIDDVDRIDEASLAFLAALANRSTNGSPCILATAATDAEPTDRLAFDVLSRRATLFTLTPLDGSDTLRLFESVFGDVPNVGTLSDAIFSVAKGNPRVSIDLAQHLVDQNLVRYEAGSWTLPARLEDAALPRSAEAAIRARIEALSPVSRTLASAQALATHRAFTREDYRRLEPSMTMSAIDRAILELISAQIVFGDGEAYVLAHRGVAAALTQSLDDTERVRLHRSLLPLYEGRSTFGIARHALLSGQQARALDELSPMLKELPEATKQRDLGDLGAADVAAIFAQALDFAEQGGRPVAEVNELRRWLASFSVGSDDAYYFRVARPWLARLQRDSGYDTWQALADVPDPAERLSRTMQEAFTRYQATPEAERVYRPDEALKGLAHYVGISLAIGSSRLDPAIIASLPALLEPFVPLSPVLHAIWQNAVAAYEATCKGQPERARLRWISVYDRLGELESEDPRFLGVFRRAVAYGIGHAEATMGMGSAVDWASRLEDDATQKINARHLQRVVCLQQGDWEGAEVLRREAEELSLWTRDRPMFTGLNAVELVACALARDLTGIKQCADRIRVLSARAPAWIPFAHLAEAYVRLACDDFSEACAAFERVLELVSPAPGRPRAPHAAWACAVAGKIEALLGLAQPEQARAFGDVALSTCQELELGYATCVVERALASAEAAHGSVDRAAARLDAIIEAQTALGVTGAYLGVTYEARARVAIRAGDAAAVERYAELTAREYRQGQGSPLEARYQRLMADVLRAGQRNQHHAADADGDPGAGVSEQSTVVILARTITEAGSLEERWGRALEVLCQATGAASGHLCLEATSGFRLMASHGPDGAPSGLDALVRAHLAAEAADLDGVTEIFDAAADRAAADLAEPAATMSLRLLVSRPTDRTGNASTPRAIVAVLAMERAPRRLEYELLNAIADQLTHGSTTPSWVRAAGSSR